MKIAVKTFKNKLNGIVALSYDAWNRSRCTSYHNEHKQDFEMSVTTVTWKDICVISVCDKVTGVLLMLMWFVGYNHNWRTC